MVVENLNTAQKQVFGLNPGPIALVLNEDDVDLAATVQHHRQQGFCAVVVVGARAAPESGADLDLRCSPKASLSEVTNALMPALTGRWVFVCHNSEFLFFPFCETRSVRDLLQFVSEERRGAVHCATVDLYSDAPDLAQRGIADDAVYFDRIGYFAQDRFDGPQKLDRQIDLFGGLKWRFAEHIPWERQGINRISLFQAHENLRLGADNRLNQPELNTLNCAWHNSLTCAIASLRVAKSLRRNPGSTHEIDRLTWDQSETFLWQSQQLMDAGLLEPGQWF